ncbi:MAG: sodium/proline symporter [Planctomycetota bacterium]
MERSTAILIALSTFLVALLAVGWRAQRQTRDADGFYLGGRTLGPWVAALAANASSSSAWSIVGTSGFAYRYGLTALWLLPGCLGGFLLNWFVVAPRLRDDTGSAITLTDYLAGPPGAVGRQPIVLLASFFTLASLLTYVASQMQAAGSAFAHAFATDPALGIAIGAGVTVAYTLLGGYLAASVTDTVQGLLMVGVAVLLPIAAVVAAGGPGELWAQIAAIDDATFHSAAGGRDGAAAAAFAIGLIGIGLGYPGQPHAVNKFMGMAKDASMTVARTVGLSWAVLLYGGMLVVGWAVRAQWPLGDGLHEQAVYEASAKLLPTLVDGVVIASVLAAIMSTVDSQLLVCASTVTHDLGLARRFPAHMLTIARATVLVIGGGALLAALVLPKNVFDNVLFAWAALGSAFGPLLLVRLWRGPVEPGFAFASMAIGGGAAIAGSYVQVLAPGFADRVLSWLLALGVALWGSRTRRSA